MIPPLLLALALAAESAPAATAATATTTPAATVAPAAAVKVPAKRPPPVPAASLPTAAGELASVDRAGHTLELKTEAGPLSLDFDRNTFVRGPSGSATPLALKPGDRLRVGRDGDRRAAWIEILPPAALSTPAAAP